MSKYNLEIPTISIEKLCIFKEAGTLNLINYSTTRGVTASINIASIVGNYDTLSNLSEQELSNPESQRKVVINNKDVSFSQKATVNFASLLQVNGCGSKYPFVSCTETGKIYKYLELGSAYIVDNINVLATVDGGDTRFVSVNYEYATGFGTQIIKVNGCNQASKFLDLIPPGYALTQVVVDPLNISNDFGSFEILVNDVHIFNGAIINYNSGATKYVCAIHNYNVMPPFVAYQYAYYYVNFEDFPVDIILDFGANTLDYDVTFTLEKKY
jgi:hypothetical protein